MLPQHLKTNVLHHPMPWSLLRYVALFILGNGVLPDMTSDVTKEHSNTNHTINVMTPGMEKLMEEYRSFKAGTKKDPVSNVKGENVKNFKLTYYSSGWEPETSLHVVTIYINSPTFDLIEKGKKIKIKQFLF